MVSWSACQQLFWNRVKKVLTSRPLPLKLRAMKYSEFSKEIRNAMKEKGISIRELGRVTDIDFSFLSRILRGERTPPSNEKIKDIARALDLDSEKLFVLAKRISPKMEPALKKNRMPDYLKTIGKLSDEDWEAISKVIEKHLMKLKR